MSSRSMVWAIVVCASFLVSIIITVSNLDGGYGLYLTSARYQVILPDDRDVRTVKNAAHSNTGAGEVCFELFY